MKFPKTATDYTLYYSASSWQTDEHAAWLYDYQSRYYTRQDGTGVLLTVGGMPGGTAEQSLTLVLFLSGHVLSRSPAF